MPLKRKKIFKMKDKADTRKQNRRELFLSTGVVRIWNISPTRRAEIQKFN